MVLVGVLTVGLPGCGGSHSPAPLVILNGADPESLDPAVMTGQSDLRIGGALFEGLMRYRATDALPEPGLAESCQVSPDGRHYTFTLRAEARWSTGAPITADDFLYSWHRILAPETGCEYAAILFYVKNAEAFHTGTHRDFDRVGIRAPSSRQFEVELENPTPFFLDLCCLPTLAAVPRTHIAAFGDRWLLQPPVPVSGAFTLAAWHLNDRVRLRRNPCYWDAAHTRSETIELLACANPSTALNLYETGAADIVWDKNLVPTDLLDVLIRRRDFHAFPVLSTYFLRFNVTRKPLDDPRVRQALGHALDRHRIVQRITRGGELPSTALTPPPPIVPGYAPPEGLAFDPDRARRLLEAAGYPGGRGFPVLHLLFDTTTRMQEQIAVEFQAMWRTHLGIDVGLRKLEWKSYLAAQRTLDYDICRSSWIGDYSDPTTFLDLFESHNGNNRTGWTDEQYDQALRAARREVDLGTRSRLLRDAETRLVHDQAPIVPIYIYTGLEYYDPDQIRGVWSNPRAEHPLRTIARVGPDAPLIPSRSPSPQPGGRP